MLEQYQIKCYQLYTELQQLNIWLESGTALGKCFTVSNDIILFSFNVKLYVYS